MPDADTSIALAAGAYVAKDAVSRLLGPTCDYLGSELKEFTRRRLDTISRVFANATEKAGDRLDEPGAVPPRVLRDILNEASFNEDAVSVEYFGGVLASSRTPTSRDDRAAALTSLLSRLSTYQIRSHYIFYSAVRSIHRGSAHTIATDVGCAALETVLRVGSYARLLALSEKETEVINAIFAHTVFGLRREQLLGQTIHISQHRFPNGQFRGIYFQPTPLGAELFLCAHGVHYKHLEEMLDRNLSLNMRSLDDLVIRSDDATTR